MFGVTVGDTFLNLDLLVKSTFIAGALQESQLVLDFAVPMFSCEGFGDSSNGGTKLYREVLQGSAATELWQFLRNTSAKASRIG